MPKSLDLELVRKAWELKHQGKALQQIADQIGMSLRQTQRYLDPKWLAAKELEDLQEKEEPYRGPMRQIMPREPGDIDATEIARAVIRELRRARGRLL
jgi:hypothetical protein